MRMQMHLSSLRAVRALLVATVCGAMVNSAWSYIPYIDACGTVSVNGVPTTNVLVTAWFCDGDDIVSNDVLAASTVSVAGLEAPFNYHIEWTGSEQGEFPGSGRAIRYYLVFSYADCDPVIVTCGEIDVLIQEYNGKILLDVDILCFSDGGEARTPGFWQGGRGFRLIDGDDITMLNGCCLRNADGSHADFGNKQEFRAWIKRRNAENMAYQLSGHLAAMKLNISEGFVDAGDLVYAPGCSDSEGDYVSIGSVVDAANTALCEDGETFAGDENRDYQECLKNALDDANNNLNWVDL